MKFADLRGILQYVPQFRGAVFVIAVDGEVVASEYFLGLLLDIAVLDSLSVKVVLVHGASHQIRALSTARGVPITSSDGLGLTDAVTLEISEEAINLLDSHILQQLTAVDLHIMPHVGQLTSFLFAPISSYKTSCIKAHHIRALVIRNAKLVSAAY
jgi:amino-acid N-acetyltransferase